MRTQTSQPIIARINLAEHNAGHLYVFAYIDQRLDECLCFRDRAGEVVIDSQVSV